MRAAMPLVGCLLLAASLSGCLGIDNMAQFKAALGFAPEPLAVEPPVVRLRASPTLALVGQPVAFSAQGSLDPAGSALDFTWDFGDGASARGSEVTHRFLRPGAFDVALRAVNLAGVEGVDAVLVTVVDNRAPIAQLSILRGGAAVQRALAGEELTFEAQVQDPEGQPLAIAWDFGDGATGLGPEARHGYARGGQYLVKVRAEDPSGLAGTAEQLLVVDETRVWQDQVSRLATDMRAHVLGVSPGLAGIKITAAFDALLGANALTVQVVDAQGDVVKEATFQPPPATSGAFEAVLDLLAADLQAHRPGDWNVVVRLASGLQVRYELTAEARY